jgi:GDP-L-fucose synthase
MNVGARIYVAGHRGLVGSALVRRLATDGHRDLLVRSHEDLDLTQQSDVLQFFHAERPEYVFLAAARVGGILANNTYPADFIQDNTAIAFNVIAAAHQVGVKKLMFFGSACVYPKHAPQPMKEEHLLSGPLEPTNEPYAIAKIAGLKLCEAYHRQHGAAFFSIMPNNVYGPNDNFDLERSHVIPALLRKFLEAKQNRAPSVTVWGSGTPRREFLHVDDLADAAVFLMDRLQGGELVNIGTGEEVTIRQLAEQIGDIVGYQGTIVWDRSKPDGTPRKLLDSTKLRSLGWSPRIRLGDGLRALHAWYVDHMEAVAR